MTQQGAPEGAGTSGRGARQLRLVVEAEDFERAVVAPRLRVAFEVDDAVASTDDLLAAGATQLAPPTQTPWRSLNSRLDAPAGLQVTLFQELD